MTTQAGGAAPAAKRSIGRRFVRKGVLVLVVIAVAVYFTMARQREDSRTAREQARELLIVVDGYTQDRAYYDGLLDRAHPAAFEESYESGGRRRAAKFDGPRYISMVFARMIREARQDGREDAAKSLDAARALLTAAQDGAGLGGGTGRGG